MSKPPITLSSQDLDRIEALLALPLATLSQDRAGLKAELERIGRCVPG